MVLGAAGLFDDAWLDKEDNSRISDFAFKWLRPVSQQLYCTLPDGNGQGPAEHEVAVHGRRTVL